MHSSSATVKLSCVQLEMLQSLLCPKGFLKRAGSTPRGHLVMSGDILGCHHPGTWWMETGDPAQPPTEHKRHPAEFSGPSVRSERLRNPDLTRDTPSVSVSVYTASIYLLSMSPSMPPPAFLPFFLSLSFSFFSFSFFFSSSLPSFYYLSSTEYVFSIYCLLTHQSM